jgi:ACR3 family arsenite efflux pump ArsB
MAARHFATDTELYSWETFFDLFALVLGTPVSLGYSGQHTLSTAVGTEAFDPAFSLLASPHLAEYMWVCVLIYPE